MKTKSLDFLSLIIAIAATVLAYADTQEPLKAISPTLADKWPVIMGVALLVSRIARLIGDWLDDGKLNNSFKAGITALIVVGSLAFLTGCVNGRPAPWLNAQACYTFPDGTRSCVGVKDGSANLLVEKDSRGYAK